jgi:23S rRNA (guanosine2251-2'-O)-methyltransferase
VRDGGRNKPQDRNERPRRRTGNKSGSFVGGRRAAGEAISAGEAVEIWVSEPSKQTPGMRAVLELAQAAGLAVVTKPRRELDGAAAENQGVIARLRGAGTALSERDIATFAFGPQAIVVVLEGITDPQNLGAAARSAEAAGAQMLVSRTVRAADVTAAAVRASAGALLHLPHARVANIPRSLERLKEVGFFVVGLAGEARASIYEEPCPQGRVALVIGSEGEGLARLTRDRCDALVRLPMLGKVGSLNASASLAAALYGYVLARSPGLGRE